MYLAISTTPEVDAFTLGRARTVAENAIAARGIALTEIEGIVARGGDTHDALREARSAALGMIESYGYEGVDVTLVLKQSSSETSSITAQRKEST